MSEKVELLIEQARTGDRLALERLLVQHSEKLRAHITRGLPRRLSASFGVDDVVQESLTQAFQRIGHLRDASPMAFDVWIRTIGEMTLVDFIRRADAQKRGGQFARRQLAKDSVTGSLVDLLEKLPGDLDTASHYVARQEGIAALQVAIAQLPGDQRQAVKLHIIDGNSLQQTAELMERSTGAVRGLVHRAKQNLSDAMGRASAWLSQR
ncbi:MAG: sigma-70 family RNA polymerase sigma factor [Planctomycetales bacterium]|nr:sigma-70 family RNA polymerase sigma factor [Planctomycetales bacterium]